MHAVPAALPSALIPSSPPQCKDEYPPFCKDELKTDQDKLKNCKSQEFKNRCYESCGYCPLATAAFKLTG